MSPKSSTGSSHRERLLSAGRNSIYDHGYNGSSVDSILQTASVPKGSFYHHFGSKEAFGFAVMERYLDQQGLLLASWVDRDDLPVPQRLGGYHSELVRRFEDSGRQWACLMGKLSNEVSASNDSFRERLRCGFLAWQSRLADVLTQGQESGEVTRDLSASSLGSIVLVMLQGGFVSALTLGADAHLPAVTDAIVDLLTAATP